MSAARRLMAVVFAALTLPFVGLLVWAARYPYHDVERSYATVIGVLGVLLFGLPAVVLAGWGFASGPRSDRDQ